MMMLMKTMKMRRCSAEMKKQVMVRQRFYMTVIMRLGRGKDLVIKHQVSFQMQVEVLCVRISMLEKCLLVSLNLLSTFRIIMMAEVHK